MQAGCDQYQKDLLLHGTFRGRSIDNIYAELLDGRLDGLIVQAPPSDPLVDRLAASHLPVIAVVDAIPSVPSVVVDDAGGSRLLARRLAERGHQRLIYLAPIVPLVSATRRRSAFLEAADQHGMQVAVWEAASMRELGGTPVQTWLEWPKDE